MTSIRRIRLLAAVGAAFVLVAVPVTASADNATMHTDKASIFAGGSITVTSDAPCGSSAGNTVGVAVQHLVSATEIGEGAVATATATTDATGMWSATATVPTETPAGSYVVTATCSGTSVTSFSYVNVPLAIEATPSTPTAAPPTTTKPATPPPAVPVKTSPSFTG